jgi:hypothetical protein
MKECAVLCCAVLCCAVLEREQNGDSWGMAQGGQPHDRGRSAANFWVFSS